jgi:phospholipid transport system substrate-binding protein
MKKRLGTLVLVCLWLLWGVPYAGAGSATEDTKAMLEQAIDIQTQPELQSVEQRPTRARLIRQLIAEHFLAADMAKDSLKDHWDALSQQQRQEFTRLFIDLFQDSYTRMVLNYLRRETVEYRGAQSERGMSRVQTSLLRVNEHIPVDYDVVRKDGRWFVRDVTIDGVSIVGNYQYQFRRVMQAQSFDELLKKMRLQSQAIQDKPT